MSHGFRLKALRKKHHYSQEFVSEKLDVERSTYSRYESNAIQPSFDSLQRLSELYQVSIDYLVSGLEKSFLSLSTQELEVMKYMREQNGEWLLSIPTLDEEAVDILKQLTEILASRR